MQSKFHGDPNSINLRGLVSSLVQDLQVHLRLHRILAKTSYKSTLIEVIKAVVLLLLGLTLLVQSLSLTLLLLTLKSELPGLKSAEWPVFLIIAIFLLLGLVAFAFSYLSLKKSSQIAKLAILEVERDFKWIKEKL